MFFCLVTVYGWCYDLPNNIQSSDRKYSMVVNRAKKTVDNSSRPIDVARAVSPSGMPSQDLNLLSKQIEIMNPKKNRGEYNKPLLVVNGNVLGNGLMINGLTYIPLREVAEISGRVVNWDSNVIYCSLDSDYVKTLFIGTKHNPVVMFDEKMVLGVLFNGVTYIPLREVECLGFAIKWEGSPFYRVKVGASNSDISWMKDWGNFNGWEAGTELVVPIYKNGSRLHQANMRNWHYAVHAGEKWGAHPALLIAIRNHENPSSSRDGFGLGVLHVKWQGIWAQYNWGSRIISRISRARGMNPLSPCREGLRKCNRQPGGYAESQSWYNHVWANYLRAIGR